VPFIISKEEADFWRFTVLAITLPAFQALLTVPFPRLDKHYSDREARHIYLLQQPTQSQAASIFLPWPATTATNPRNRAALIISCVGLLKTNKTHFFSGVANKRGCQTSKNQSFLGQALLTRVVRASPHWQLEPPTTGS
jgi:hypothetical protein